MQETGKEREKCTHLATYCSSEKEKYLDGGFDLKPQLMQVETSKLTQLRTYLVHSCYFCLTFLWTCNDSDRNVLRMKYIRSLHIPQLSKLMYSTHTVQHNSEGEQSPSFSIQDHSYNHYKQYCD